MVGGEEQWKEIFSEAQLKGRSRDNIDALTKEKKNILWQTNLT